MKLTTYHLRKIIREQLLLRAQMVHEIRDMGNDRIEEFWGKNSKKPEENSPNKNIDPLGAAATAMKEVVLALWGPWDDSPNPELLKKAQDLHKEIMAASKKTR